MVEAIAGTYAFQSDVYLEYSYFLLPAVNGTATVVDNKCFGGAIGEIHIRAAAPGTYSFVVCRAFFFYNHLYILT